MLPPMSRSIVLAPGPFLFLAASLASAFASADVPRRPPNGIPHSPVTGFSASKGWPHETRSATTTTCARTPNANEVIVYKDPNFGGACAVLTGGFYPYGTNLGIGNDAIRSMKVGSGMRARAFYDAGYAGQWTQYTPGTSLGTLGPTWDHQISSMRIEPGNRSSICDDLQEGEVALFEGWNGTGDCVVLPGDGAYPTADAMGIANDSISAANNNSALRMHLFFNQNFNMEAAPNIEPHTFLRVFPMSHGMSATIDNQCSSMLMQKP